jgi:tRNA (adenine22-N1)-methyltransferase
MRDDMIGSSPERRLPRRLLDLLDLAGTSTCLADVGTDHALLPAHAVLRGIAARAIAVDVREAPLVQARATLARFGLTERVMVKQGDGLEPLAGHAVDVAVLAGLRGVTFLAWCRRAPGVVMSLRRLVVQPNGDLAEVRAWAHGEGLWLVDEKITWERGRCFVSCAFEPGRGPDPAYVEGSLSLTQAFELGPWLVRRRALGADELYAQHVSRLEKLVAVGRSDLQPELDAYKLGRELLAHTDERPHLP